MGVTGMEVVDVFLGGMLCSGMMGHTSGGQLTYASLFWVQANISLLAGIISDCLRLA